jgi:hypothetical protein
LKKVVKKEYIRTTVLSKSLSHCFLANSSMYLMGMKFKGRNSLSIYVTKFKSFKISVLKFFESFLKASVGLTFFCHTLLKILSCIS